MSPRTEAEVYAILTSYELALAVERQMHRVLCGGSKHRSKWTGECRSAASVALGLTVEFRRMLDAAP